ncbi:MAG: AzlD domain-containing protein [Thermoleophilia bacterium]
MSGQLWAVVAGCAAVTFAIKAAGPVALGGRDLPPRLRRVIVLMAPALLAAFVVTQALADGERLHVGADTAGVAAAGFVVWRGASVLPAVVTAVAVTAALRAIG